MDCLLTAATVEKPFVQEILLDFIRASPAKIGYCK